MPESSTMVTSRHGERKGCASVPSNSSTMTRSREPCWGRWRAGQGKRACKLCTGLLVLRTWTLKGCWWKVFRSWETWGTIYNFPYYPVHLEKNGYRKDVDWVEFEVKVPVKVHEKLKQIAEVVTRRNGLEILQIAKKQQLLSYANEIFRVLNESYKGLYGVFPLTQRQIDMYISRYLKVVHHEYVSIILDRDGRVAAFAVTVPSLAKALQKCRGSLFPMGFLHISRALRKNDAVELCLIAVRPDLQGKGVNAVLMHELNKIYLRHNILRAESNPELETNTRVQAQWKFFDARQHKRRRCYIKDVS